MSAELQAHFVTYGLEGVGYSDAAYRLALSPVAVHLIQLSPWMISMDCRSVERNHLFVRVDLQYSLAPISR